MNYTKLPSSFYTSTDVLYIAKELLGKLLITQFDGSVCIGRIVETEAYLGETDRASHAFGGRRTSRTETMYLKGGVTYVYLCYGIHHLINVVTGPQNLPHAVLIRAIEPVHGREIMMKRMQRQKWDKRIGSGPGNVTKALGITLIHHAVSCLSDHLFIASDGYVLADDQIKTTPRIGVDYAGDDAAKPYRFVVKDHPYVSAAGFTKKWIREH